jgi:thiamine kinase-like enzyme
MFRLIIVSAAFSLFNRVEAITHMELQNQIHEEQVSALQEALDHLQIKQPEFKPLAGGMSGIQLYAFSSNSQDFVLRFIKPKHPLEARQNEVQALQIGHALGIAPQCIFADQNALVTILPLIRGSALSSDDLDPSALGTTLQKLHSYSGKFPKQSTLIERIQRQYEKGKLANAAYPSSFEKEVAKISSEPVSKLVPCHGDLNLSNILIENHQPLLIDWTTATLDDPYTDLGCLCLSANMNIAQEMLFLEAYLGRAPTPQDFHLLHQGKLKASCNYSDTPFPYEKFVVSQT